MRSSERTKIVYDRSALADALVAPAVERERMRGLHIDLAAIPPWNMKRIATHTRRRDDDRDAAWPQRLR